MERRLIVSGGGGLRVFSLPALTLERRVRLDGAGALCGAGDAVFCACDPGSAIWRLNGETLTPAALFAGGPGVCQLALSPDGRRLYALCADADSVLMLDAGSGAPMMLGSVGLNPRQMALDASGRLLAVAGGAYSAAVLLCAQTFSVQACVPMPGPVCAVAPGATALHALCLNEALSTTLASSSGGAVRARLTLAGMPGALLAREDGLLAATQDRIHTLTPDGLRLLRARDGPGRPGRLLLAGGCLLAWDQLSEALFVLGKRSGRWHPVCDQVRDMLAL